MTLISRQHPIGGICVDLSNMDRILEIHEADSDLVCQPGARWMDINETLKEEGSSHEPLPSHDLRTLLTTSSFLRDFIILSCMFHDPFHLCHPFRSFVARSGARSYYWWDVKHRMLRKCVRLPCLFPIRTSSPLMHSQRRPIRDCQS